MTPSLPWKDACLSFPSTLDTGHTVYQMTVALQTLRHLGDWVACRLRGYKEVRMPGLKQLRFKVLIHEVWRLHLIVLALLHDTTPVSADVSDSLTNSPIFTPVRLHLLHCHAWDENSTTKPAETYSLSSRTCDFLRGNLQEFVPFTRHPRCQHGNQWDEEGR